MPTSSPTGSSTSDPTDYPTPGKTAIPPTTSGIQDVFGAEPRSIHTPAQRAHSDAQNTQLKINTTRWSAYLPVLSTRVCVAVIAVAVAFPLLCRLSSRNRKQPHHQNEMHSTSHQSLHVDAIDSQHRDSMLRHAGNSWAGGGGSAGTYGTENGGVTASEYIDDTVWC
jgi:hypothetical protein